MKKIKVFTLNKEGKIEFTKEQLEQLLNETYNEGYADGGGNHFIWTQPYLTNDLNLSTTTSSGAN